jgi:hypothetical protein
MDICDKNPDLKVVYDEIHKLILLYLTVPLSNASAERSFSCLRRVKTYLRNRLTQEHLNHHMILNDLNVHKGLTDSIELKTVATEFVRKNERRRRDFGNF